MTGIRAATSADLEWLIDADLRADGLLVVPEHDAAAHRAKIEAFVRGPYDGAWVHEAEHGASPCPLGMILARFRDPTREHDDPFVRMLFAKVLARLEPPWPADAAFAEVFQLWVEPGWRRRGIARGLKRRLEHEARARGLGLVYTHTRVSNPQVIALNLGLGYTEVRRGGLWDEVPRCSLIKRL
ncbi:MAG: GNAT family N-acetyltransferase [Myxococcales bacterium]|nr:GNAT family N-acetyltransferase [Myxococcales bacterium]MCB9715834.1 GNAT family N-acetyltransferase [Myxococcales bacterium]